MKVLGADAKALLLQTEDVSEVCVTVVLRV